MRVLLLDSTNMGGGPKLYSEMITSRLLGMNVNASMKIIEGVAERYVWDTVRFYEKIGKSLARRYSGKIDLVHSLTGGIFSVAAVELSKILDVPSVLSVHGLVTQEFLFISGRSFRNRYRAKILGHYEKKWLKKADAIITFSNFEKETIEGKYGSLPIHVLYHGSDHIPKINLPEKRSGISYSKPSFRKGFEHFKAIASRLPELQFTLFGAKEETGLKNVIHLPFVPDYIEYCKELARTSLLIHPSRHDSFCIVVLEAMRLGVVPIVSEYTGAKEIMNGNGEVLPLRVNEWVDTVKRVYHSYGESDRRKMKATAEKYTWGKTTQRHLELYKKLAG